MLFAEDRTANLTFEFQALIADLHGISIGDEGPQHLDPKQIFGYLYSIVNSPEYRTRFETFFRVDFPRIPITNDSGLFKALAALGNRLISLHLLESLSVNKYTTSIVGSGDFQIEKVSYCNETVWIDKAKTKGFKGLHQEVWNFKIGSYQVCEKWLKDRQAKGGKNPRPGLVLTDEDISHYQKIVVALSETISIMAEIDKVIEKHGGWPDAFKS